MMRGEVDKRVGLLVGMGVRAGVDKARGEWYPGANLSRWCCPSHVRRRREERGFVLTGQWWEQLGNGER